jgi:hypothetical protein
MIYLVELTDGQTFRFSADLVQAAAGISVNFHDPDDANDWQPTPYQTADARHSAWQAALLLAEHYATDRDDCTEVRSVEPQQPEEPNHADEPSERGN